MASTALARELAEVAGTRIDDAARFVDEVGEQQARRLIDRVEDSGGLDIGWKIPAAAAGASGVGLAVRQQDVAEAQAAAAQAQNRQQAVSEIIGSSTLSADQKSELLDELLEQQNQGRRSTDSDQDGGPLAFVTDLFGDDLQGTIVGVIVLLVVIMIITNYASESLLPDASVEIGGGGGGQ